MLLFYFVVISGYEKNNDYLLNLDEHARRVSKEEEKGRNFFHLGSNSVIIFENTLTGVVAALQCCDRRWLFLAVKRRAI